MDDVKSHASDCALHGAPAKAPEPCTCGASKRFRLYDYDVTNDTFGWRTFSRETLIAEVVSTTLVRAYGGPQRVVRPGVLVARAVESGLTSNEATLISDAWRDTWSSDRYAASRNARNASYLSREDGTYVDPADEPDLTREPDLEEMRAAMSGFIEYWRTLSEPAITIRDGRVAA